MALAVLLVVIVALLVVLARKRRVQPAAEAAAAKPAGETAATAPASDDVVTIDFTRPDQRLRLASSFRRALRDLRRHLGSGVGARDFRYRLPWVLLVGETASGKAGMLGRCALDLPLGAPDEPVPEEGAGCAWWLLDRGVVLDVAGDFVLGPDGKGSSRRAWGHLLNALRSARPQRPLDGIVLALPCDGLLGAESAAIAHKASLLCNKLREAQRQLGMVLPVYVLVTRCEHVPGFVSFFREVPERARCEMFGWSSPYAPDTPFRPEWVDEGFDTVGAGLRKTQLQILGERIQIDEPDGVFVFPTELQAVREPLRTFLAAMFKPTTFSEPLGLRGFYFTGELPAAALEPGPDAARARDLGWSAAASPVLFLRDLFDTKVFAERGLARPAAGALESRGHAVLAVQAALLAFVLVAGIGTWWARDRLAERRPGLDRFVDDVRQQVEEAERAQTPLATADGGKTTSPSAADPAGYCPDIASARDNRVLVDRAFDLVRSLSTFDGRSYHSAFLPTSWLSPFDRELKQLIGIAYDHTVFEALESGLIRQARDLLLAAPAPAAPASPLRAILSGASRSATLTEGDGDATDEGEGWEAEEEERQAGAALATPPGFPDQPAVADLEELARLRRFVQDVQQLEARVHVYNALQSTEDLKGLADLLDGVFARSAPPGFLDNASLYRQALRFVDYPAIRFSCWQPDARATASRLAGALLERLDRNNAAVQELQRLDAELQSVAAKSDFTEADQRALANQAGRLQHALALPNLAWIHGARFEPWPELQTVLSKLRSSELLGTEAESAILKDGDARWNELESTLEAPYTIGPLLAREAPGKPWGPSPNVTAVEAALADLRNETFMEERSFRRFQTAIPPGFYLRWNVGQLAAATGYYKPYEAFVEGAVSRFPDALRGALRRVALRRLNANITQEIAGAQALLAAPRLDSSLIERSVKDQVDNLQAAMPPLSELIGQFDKLDEAQTSEALASLLAAQGCGVLRAVDRLLTAEAPYAPKGGNFAWWQGGRPLTLEAYDVQDPAGLAAYLEAQRSRLAVLSEQYAEPVLRALGDRSCPDPAMWPVVKRWQGITAELRRYEAKKPGNSVAVLETFLDHDLAAVDAGSCLRELAPRRASDSGSDFFLLTRASLRRQLFQRCQDLTQQQALAGYRQLERYFNQRLAGRFPFAGVPGQLDKEADPEDVRTFFKIYDARAPMVLALPAGDPQFGDQEREIRAFLERMGSVRKLFAQFLDDPAHPEVPTFGLDVEFRTNVKHEQGGNQVIRWELVSGRQRFSRDGSDTQGSWTLGDKVRLSLQWAKDGRTVPLPPLPPSDAGQPRQLHVRVDDRTVSYEYGGRWSLFALLREYASQPGDFAGSPDPRPQTLRFAVDTAAAPPAAPAGEAEEKAKPAAGERKDRTVVFVRVTLTSLEKDKRQDLELPAFPSRAPALAAAMDDLPVEAARGGG